MRDLLDLAKVTHPVLILKQIVNWQRTEMER
jgi:hypothetical protein